MSLRVTITLPGPFVVRVRIPLRHPLARTAGCFNILASCRKYETYPSNLNLWAKPKESRVHPTQRVQTPHLEGRAIPGAMLDMVFGPEVLDNRVPGPCGQFQAPLFLQQVATNYRSRRQHKDKDPEYRFWNSRSFGPSDPNRRFLCFCGLWGPQLLRIRERSADNPEAVCLGTFTEEISTTEDISQRLQGASWYVGKSPSYDTVTPFTLGPRYALYILLHYAWSKLLAYSLAAP